MEPRFFERGNEILLFCREVIDIPLQWSRAFLSAEMKRTLEERLAMLELQWSRAFLSAEIIRGSPSRSPPRGCFNGAALF